MLSNDVYSAFACECGYTVSLDLAPDRCPSCGETNWHIAEGAQDTHLIMCCCWCHRIDLHDGRGYVEAEEAEERLGSKPREYLISHGICHPCYDKANETL